MASLEEDILPAVLDYLPRIGVKEEEISHVARNLSYTNCEDVLEQYGIIVSEQPSQYDMQNKGKTTVASVLAHQIFSEDI